MKKVLNIHRAIPGKKNVQRPVLNVNMKKWHQKIHQTYLRCTKNGIYRAFPKRPNVGGAKHYLIKMVLEFETPLKKIMILIYFLFAN